MIVFGIMMTVGECSEIDGDCENNILMKIKSNKSFNGNAENKDDNNVEMMISVIE